MAEGETPEAGCGSPADQAQQLIYGAGSLEYQLEQFLESGGQEAKILLSGKTGVGKSRLTNALIGEELAEEGEDLDPRTDAVTAYEFVKNKVTITVFDTPGLADATGNDEEYLRKIQAKEKTFDLFLFCTELNTTRFRNDDLETMKKLTSTLGLQIWKHAIVVFTFANEIRPSPSQKAKDVPEKDVFIDRLAGLKKKIKEALISIGVPEKTVTNVPFVPAGDLSEPRLPDRNNWITVFWTTAFKRINRNAKMAFLVANVDRFDENKLICRESVEDDKSGLSINGLTAEEVHVVRAVKQKLQETSFTKKLEGCLLKPRVYDEDGTKIKMNESSSQDVITKEKSFPSIEMDEPSSKDVITEMVGDIARNLVGDLIGPKSGRFYQTFFGLVVRYLKPNKSRW